jgi:hypothetical protein
VTRPAATELPGTSEYRPGLPRALTYRVLL